MQHCKKGDWQFYAVYKEREERKEEEEVKNKKKEKKRRRNLVARMKSNLSFETTISQIFI
jgi:hypothetical protein